MRMSFLFSALSLAIATTFASPTMAETTYPVSCLPASVSCYYMTDQGEEDWYLFDLPQIIPWATNPTMCHEGLCYNEDRRVVGLDRPFFEGTFVDPRSRNATCEETLGCYYLNENGTKTIIPVNELPDYLDWAEQATHCVGYMCFINDQFSGLNQSYFTP